MLLGHNSLANTDINTDLTTKTGDPVVETRSQRDWYLDVTETDASKMTIDITFDFTEMGLSTFPLGNASNYSLMYRATNEPDDEWTVIAAGSSINGDQVTFSNISDLDTDGFITLGSINHADSPLPVTLIHFKAIARDRDVSIKWSTADERNNAFFSLERSADGVNFKEIALRTSRGDSNDIIYYEIIDSNPLEGANYYRLKQVDHNGNYDLSEISRVSISIPQTHKISLYPNPVANILQLKPDASFKDGRLMLRNGRGRVVMRKDIGGASTLEIDVSGLQEGVYILEAHGIEKTETHKILIRR